MGKANFSQLASQNILLLIFLIIFILNLCVSSGVTSHVTVFIIALEYWLSDTMSDLEGNS